MTIHVDYESETVLEFDYEAVIRECVTQSSDFEECPYEIELSVVITDNDSICRMNNEYRGINSPTDVLSFPMIEYSEPSDFSQVEEQSDLFHPETGELLLGDIMISADKVVSQALEYGHSPKRELAFLVVHSMLHLFGYDHMEEHERVVMEEKQDAILQSAGILRI